MKIQFKNYFSDKLIIYNKKSLEFDKNKNKKPVKALQLVPLVNDHLL